MPVNQEIQAVFQFRLYLITPTRFEMSKGFTQDVLIKLCLWLTFLETSHLKGIMKWPICGHSYDHSHLRSWSFFQLIIVAVLSHKIRLQVVLQWKGLLYSKITKLSKRFVFELCDFSVFTKMQVDMTDIYSPPSRFPTIDRQRSFQLKEIRNQK